MSRQSLLLLPSLISVFTSFSLVDKHPLIHLKSLKIEINLATVVLLIAHRGWRDCCLGLSEVDFQSSLVCLALWLPSRSSPSSTPHSPSMPPGSGPMHQLWPVSLPSENVSLSAGRPSMTRSPSSKVESDPWAPSSEERSGTALSPHRLQSAMIETVGQWLITSGDKHSLPLHTNAVYRNTF